jgi:redox-sensitive bicupin YhaK (pirin superfamily)
VTTEDATTAAEPTDQAATRLEVSESREAQVGALRVRRALPRRQRRSVGAWCFVDHMGPAAVTEERGVDIGPHPHIGLQTVTWLVAGEILHRDSLGSEQVIKPGQLNLMTAGDGVAHAEERTGAYRGELHGVQLWVAQPESTRHGRPAFEHHAVLPQAEFGSATATVFVGSLGGVSSPARRDTEHVGVELMLRPGVAVMPCERSCEYALVVLVGAVSIEGQWIVPGHLAYVGADRDELELAATEDTRALLIGGVPFDESILVWWNFVARTEDEITLAQRQWMANDARFGCVDSTLTSIPVGPPPWALGKPTS